MYNFLTVPFLFFLTIVIASPSGFAKMSPKELDQLKKQITQVRNAKNFGIATMKQSSCLEHLKQFSSLPTFGGLTDGKNFIMDPSYTLSYSYNGNTRKYSPVLTKIINDRVVVVSPKGTARTSGRHCHGDKSETSSQLLSKWIKQSGKNVEKYRRFGRRLKSAKEKKTYFKSLDRAEAQRKNILQICSSSKLRAVSIAAQKALRKSVDFGGAGHRAKKQGGVQ